jgi:hypothetical protein
MMLETIVVAVIVLAAALWFVRWLRGAAAGNKGCSCGSCGKQHCPSRTSAMRPGADGEGR